MACHSSAPLLLISWGDRTTKTRPNDVRTRRPTSYGPAPANGVLITATGPPLGRGEARPPVVSNGLRAANAGCPILIIGPPFAAKTHIRAGRVIHSAPFDGGRIRPLIRR